MVISTNGGAYLWVTFNNDGLPGPSILQEAWFFWQGDYTLSQNFKFQEIAGKSRGICLEGYGTALNYWQMLMGDRGYLDIYVCRSAAKMIYKRKKLTFFIN